MKPIRLTQRAPVKDAKQLDIDQKQQQIHVLFVSLRSWLRLWSMTADVIYTSSWSANKFTIRLTRCRTGQNASSLTGFDLLLFTRENVRSILPQTPVYYSTPLWTGARPTLEKPHTQKSSALLAFNERCYDKKPFLNPLDRLNTDRVTSKRRCFCWDGKVGPFTCCLH